MKTYPKLKKPRPSAIFTGCPGSRPRWPSHDQSPAKRGARRKMSPALTDWNHVVGTSKPPSIRDRKSTRLNSSHGSISYAVFCLKKKNIKVVLGHCEAGVLARGRRCAVALDSLHSGTVSEARESFRRERRRRSGQRRQVAVAADT